MAKSIIIRSSIRGGWCGYQNPAPKTPTKDSVLEWREFDQMVEKLKTMRVPVIVYSDDLHKRLARKGVIASRGEKK